MPGPNGVWNLISSPNIGWPNNYLYGVSGVASNDVWAVGTYGTLGTTDWQVIERWNGSSWSIFSSPNPSGGGNLFGVAAIKSCDVWAVGQTYMTNIGYQTLNEHFTCN